MNTFKENVENKQDAELMKMVYEFDQWSPEMLLAIEQELSKRNILPNDINTQKEQLAEIEATNLSNGKEASLLGQIIGWLTVFGLLGIFIGHHYCFSKVRSKYSDKQYFTYDEASRKNGSYLFYSSIILSILGILFKITTAYN